MSEQCCQYSMIDRRDRWFDAGEGRGGRSVLVGRRVDGYRSDRCFECEGSVTVSLGESDGRRNSGMTAERYFGDRGEVPDPAVARVASEYRFDEERRLGIPDFGCNRL